MTRWQDSNTNLLYFIVYTLHRTELHSVMFSDLVLAFPCSRIVWPPTLPLYPHDHTKGDMRWHLLKQVPVDRRPGHVPAPRDVKISQLGVKCWTWQPQGIRSHGSWGFHCSRAIPYICPSNNFEAATATNPFLAVASNNSTSIPSFGLKRARQVQCLQGHHQHRPAWSTILLLSSRLTITPLAW